MGAVEGAAEDSPKSPKELAVIIMGSIADESHSKKIGEVLGNFGIDYQFRIGSAHKTPEFVLEMVRNYDSLPNHRIVYITVAGRSNALTAFVDASTKNPVIAAPPYDQRYPGMDIPSSLRVPSGIASSVAIESEAAALHAVKIFALSNPDLRIALEDFQQGNRNKIFDSDVSIREVAR